MATQFIDFVPSIIQAPSFQVTLGSSIYRAVVSWNIAAQRYFLELYQLDGTRVFTRALVGSPVGVAIEAMSWANGLVTVETARPHGLMLYAQARVTISGVSPAAYNGTKEVFVSGRDTFTYPLADNPGEVVLQGSASQNLNMVDGYFPASSLVFRQANNQFEVSDL